MGTIDRMFRPSFHTREVMLLCVHVYVYATTTGLSQPDEDELIWHFHPSVPRTEVEKEQTYNWSTVHHCVSMSLWDWRSCCPWMVWLGVTGEWPESQCKGRWERGVLDTPTVEAGSMGCWAHLSSQFLGMTCWMGSWLYLFMQKTAK